MSVDDQLAALARIRDHLRPGGRLALDVFDPNPTRMGIAEEPEAGDVTFVHEGRTLTRRASVRRTRATQAMDVRAR